LGMIPATKTAQAKRNSFKKRREECVSVADLRQRHLMCSISFVFHLLLLLIDFI